MLRKIKGLSEFPEEAHSIATGDVLSHLSVSTDFKIDDENSIHVSLLPNSSFLEVCSLTNTTYKLINVKTSQLNYYYTN